MNTKLVGFFSGKKEDVSFFGRGMAATATHRGRDGSCSKRRRCLSLLFPRWGYDIWMRKNLIWIFSPTLSDKRYPPLMSVPPVKGEQRGAKDFFIAQFSLSVEGKEKVFPDISEENAFFCLAQVPPNLISNPLKKRKRKKSPSKNRFFTLFDQIGGWINIVNHTPEYIQLFSPAAKTCLAQIVLSGFSLSQIYQQSFWQKKYYRK